MGASGHVTIARRAGHVKIIAVFTRTLSKESQIWLTLSGEQRFPGYGDDKQACRQYL
jgi:hypothetical protein